MSIRDDISLNDDNINRNNKDNAEENANIG